MWFFKIHLVLLIGIFKSSHDNALRQMPQNLNDKSSLVRVMAWCHQATSHYLNHCWLRSMLRYDVARPKLVNISCIQTFLFDNKFLDLFMYIYLFSLTVYYNIIISYCYTSMVWLYGHIWKIFPRKLWLNPSVQTAHLLVLGVSLQNNDSRWLITCSKFMQDYCVYWTHCGQLVMTQVITDHEQLWWR